MILQDMLAITEFIFPPTSSSSKLGFHIWMIGVRAHVGTFLKPLERNIMFPSSVATIVWFWRSLSKLYRRGSVRTQNWDSIRLEEMNEEFFEFLHLEQLAVSSKHLQLSLIESFLVLLLAQLKNSKSCTLVGWPMKWLKSYQSLYLLIWLLSLLLLQFVLSSGHNYTYAFYILLS